MRAARGLRGRGAIYTVAGCPLFRRMGARRGVVPLCCFCFFFPSFYALFPLTFAALYTARRAGGCVH